MCHLRYLPANGGCLRQVLQRLCELSFNEQMMPSFQVRNLNPHCLYGIFVINYGRKKVCLEKGKMVMETLFDFVCTTIFFQARLCLCYPWLKHSLITYRMSWAMFQVFSWNMGLYFGIYWQLEIIVFTWGAGFIAVSSLHCVDPTHLFLIATRCLAAWYFLI